MALDLLLSTAEDGRSKTYGELGGEEFEPLLMANASIDWLRVNVEGRATNVTKLP